MRSMLRRLMPCKAGHRPQRLLRHLPRLHNRRRLDSLPGLWGTMWRMFTAPIIQMHGTHVIIPDGIRGIESTIGAMRAMVDTFKTNFDVRQLATSLVFNVTEKDEFAEARAIFNYVRDQVRYLRDIHGVETLCAPNITMRSQVGDCDDQSTLLAALLESIGYPTRFVIAGYNVENSPEHVYTQVLLNGVWIDADPTEREPLGYAPPDPVNIWYEVR